MRRVILGAGVLAVLLGAQPAVAAPAADVTLHCTAYEGLPPGPAEPVGHITVVVKGQVKVDRSIPGPCAAPGWNRVHGS